MTPLVDTILLVALAVTSACVVPMYLKLKRLDRTQAEYGRILTESGHALNQAGEAVRGFSTEGREILEALGARIDEARRTLAELEASRQALLRDRPGRRVDARLASFRRGLLPRRRKPPEFEGKVARGLSLAVKPTTFDGITSRAHDEQQPFDDSEPGPTGPSPVFPSVAAPAEAAAEARIGDGRNLDSILRIPVLIQVVLGSATMPVANLMKLGRGAIVALDHRVGEPVDVTVNGRVVARGEIVVVEEDNSRFGVSLTEIVGPADSGQNG